MADHIAHVPGGSRRRAGVRLCGHTNISLIAAFERLRALRVHHHSTRTGGAPRRGWVCPRVGRARSRPAPRRPGITNATTGVATAAFDSIPLRRDRRRRAVLLRGPRTTPGVQPPPGRGPDLGVRAVRETGVAGSPRRPVPRILARAWDLALAGRPGPVLVSVPMDILAEALEAAVVPATPSRGRRSTNGNGPRHRGRTSWSRATTAPRRRRNEAGRTGGPWTGRADWHAGRPYPDGHRSPSARPSSAPGDGRVLGVVRRRRPAGPGGRRHPGGGDALPRNGQQQLGAGVTFQIPPDATDPCRPRSSRAGSELSSRHRRHGRRRAGARAIAVAYGDATPERGTTGGGWARARRVPGAQPRKRKVRRVPAAAGADPGRGPARSPDAILVTDVGWNKNGVAQQYPVDDPDSFLTPGGFSTMGFGPAAVLGVVVAGAGRPPSHWLATARSARIRAWSPPRSRWASARSGSS